MRMLRSLLRDDWALGIAAAAALAYVTIRLIEAVVTAVFSTVDGQPAAAFEDFPFELPFLTVTINGRIVYLLPVAQAAMVFAIAIALVALVLHATREEESSAPSRDA